MQQQRQRHQSRPPLAAIGTNEQSRPNCCRTETLNSRKGNERIGTRIPERISQTNPIDDNHTTVGSHGNHRRELLPPWDDRKQQHLVRKAQHVAEKLGQLKHLSAERNRLAAEASTSSMQAQSYVEALTNVREMLLSLPQVSQTQDLVETVLTVPSCDVARNVQPCTLSTNLGASPSSAHGATKWDELVVGVAALEGDVATLRAELAGSKQVNCALLAELEHVKAENSRLVTQRAAAVQENAQLRLCLTDMRQTVSPEAAARRLYELLPPEMSPGGSPAPPILSQHTHQADNSLEAACTSSMQAFWSPAEFAQSNLPHKEVVLPASAKRMAQLRGAWLPQDNYNSPPSFSSKPPRHALQLHEQIAETSPYQPGACWREWLNRQSPCALTVHPTAAHDSKATDTGVESDGVAVLMADLGLATLSFPTPKRISQSQILQSPRDCAVASSFEKRQEVSTPMKAGPSPKPSSGRWSSRLEASRSAQK